MFRRGIVSTKPNAGVPLSMFWNFLDRCRPGGTKGLGHLWGLSIRLNRGMHYSWSGSEKRGEPMGDGFFINPVKGEPRLWTGEKKEKKKESCKRGEEKSWKKRSWVAVDLRSFCDPTKGLDIIRYWSEEEEEKGFFKEPAAYRGRNYICTKHAQVLLCCGGNHFQRWGLEGRVNQRCLLWGLFITKKKIFLTARLCSKFFFLHDTF